MPKTTPEKLLRSFSDLNTTTEKFLNEIVACDVLVHHYDDSPTVDTVILLRIGGKLKDGATLPDSWRKSPYFSTDFSTKNT